MKPAVRSAGHHHLAVAGIQPHQSAVLLVGAISALDLPVAPLLHADTGAVPAGELVLTAGGHCHVPAVVRATAVIVDLPGLGPQQEGACRGRAHGIEIRVLGASRFPL